MLSTDTINALVVACTPEYKADAIRASIERKWTAAHSAWFRKADKGEECAKERAEFDKVCAVSQRAGRLCFTLAERRRVETDKILADARKRGEL